MQAPLGGPPLHQLGEHYLAEALERLHVAEEGRLIGGHGLDHLLVQAVDRTLAQPGHQGGQ